MNNALLENKKPLNPKHLKIIEVIVIIASIFVMIFDTLRYLGVIDRRLLKMSYGFFPNLIHPSVNFSLWVAFYIILISVIAVICYLTSKSEIVKKSEYGMFKFIFHIIIAILILFILRFVIILLWILTGHVVPLFP